MTTLRHAEAHSTCQLVGDYGVYATGEMLQVNLPSMTSLRPAADAATHVVETPFPTLFYGDGGWSLVRSRAKDKIERTLDRLQKDGVLAGRMPLVVRSRAPYGVGIEDNICLLVVSLLSDASDPVEIALRTCKCERPNASYIYLLPPILSRSPAQAFPLYRLKREMPCFSSWGEFREKNLAALTSANVLTWMSAAQGLAPEPTDLQSKQSFDLMVVARPKAPIEKSIAPSISSVVDSLPLDRCWSVLEVLGSLTARVSTLLTDLSSTRQGGVAGLDIASHWHEVGALMTAYHFAMHAIGRTDVVSNRLVMDLQEHRFVHGAKCVAGGPGGSVIILYSYPHESRNDWARVVRRLAALAHRHGYRVVERSVLRWWAERLTGYGGEAESPV
jgi:hypothetical protein